MVEKVRGIAADRGGSTDVVERTYRALIAAFIDLQREQHRAGAGS
ncbi:hypothetical protein [Microbacterium soli]